MIEMGEFQQKKYVVDNVEITRFFKDDSPQVSVCIPLYEWDEWFEQAINSILKYKNSTTFEVVVANCLQSVARNRNAAQREARSDYVCQYDGDADATSDYWLDKLYDTYVLEKNIGVIGVVTVFPNGTIDHCGTLLIKNRIKTDQRLDLLFPTFPRERLFMIKELVDGNIAEPIPYEENKDQIDNNFYDVFQCTGVVMLYDRRRVGEFSAAVYEKSGWDDTDLLWKARDCGYRIVVHGKVKITHPNHIRSDEENAVRINPKVKRAFSGENLLKYILRHGDI
jgi:glycosyltransferase involved in cell wall biosynthesis